MSYAYELEKGGVAITNNLRGVEDNPYIEVTEFPDAPRESWRIVDGVLSFDADLKASIEAKLTLTSAQEARDEALANLTHDFGDGRIIQVRKQDKDNFDTAIELLELAGETTTDWVMLDNVKYPVTLEELKTALLAGKIAAKAIWDAYETQPV